MSLRTLPQPPGPYHVGTGSRELVDLNRTSQIVSDGLGRKIFVKFWYPTNKSFTDDSKREALWEQLRTESNIPGIVRLLLRRAMKTMTNSYLDAPISAEVSPFRILIYNHGMISFAAENTILMEYLASRGYIVLALQHKEQLQEFQTLQKRLPEQLKKEQSLLQKDIQSAVGSKRAELSSRYFEIALNTNLIVSARTADVAFIVKNINDILGVIPGIKQMEACRIIGVLGLSLGGAVATEYARNNPELSCVINIDGGIYGEKLGMPISHPYLMLYSQENSDSNEIALNANKNPLIKSETIKDTKHMNYHDISFIYPILRLLKTVGKANPSKVINRRNQLIGDFISNVEATSA